MHRDATDVDASIEAGLGVGEKIHFTTVHRDATDVDTSIEADLEGGEKINVYNPSSRYQGCGRFD